MALQLLSLKVILAVLFPNKEARTFFATEFGRTSTASLTPAELDARAAVASSWQNFVVNVLFSYVLAAFFEETLKYMPILYAKHLYPSSDAKPNPRNRAYLDFALAGALSFGLVENIAFLYQAVEGAGQSWIGLLITAMERLVFASAGHLLAAALTALKATSRDFYGQKLSWGQVMMPAMVLHGAQNFVAMSMSATEGNVGWIHPAGGWNT